MALYVTPERYKAMGFGLDLEGVEDFELRSILTRASAIVDSYCAVPLLPQKHSFLGGTITNEEHRWDIGTEVSSGSRRFYFWHRPLKAISQFRIYVTNQQYVEITPAEMFVNNSEGYAEVVALAITTVGIFGAGIIPNVGLANPVAKMSYTYGYSFPVTDEVIEATDGLLYRATNQFWTSDTVTVKRNGTTITSGFTVDRTEGTIEFTSANAATDVISVSYTHTLPGPIAEATGLIATHLLGEHELAAKGMDGVARLRVAEVEITRMGYGRGSSSSEAKAELVEPEVIPLLAPYVFMTAR